MWFFTTVLTISIFVIGLQAHDHVIHPNTGIIMHKLKEITIDPMMWHHTIAIPFFKNISLESPVIRCSGQSPAKSCLDVEDGLVSELLDLYDALRYNIASDIIQKQNTVKDMIGLNSAKNHNRKKRGWVDIIGRMAKTVIGVATQQDITILNNHMEQLALLVEKEAAGRTSNAAQMHSFEVQVNGRLNNTISQVNFLEKVMHEGFEASRRLKDLLLNKLKLPERVNEIEDILDKHHHLNAMIHQYDLHIESLEQISHKTENVITALAQFMHGRLDANIISPKELHLILNYVDSQLREISSSKSIMADVNSYYVQNHFTTFSHDGKSIFIKLKIPIVSDSSTFNLYKMEAVPVPTDHTNRSDVYTLVTGFTEYLAVSFNEKFYLELSEKEIASINMNYQYVPAAVNEQSCSFSAYNGDLEGMLELCTNVVLEDISVFREFIYHMMSGEILLYTPDITWALMCNDTDDQEIVRSKSLLKVEIGCKCYLKYNELELHRYDSQCSEVNSVSKIWYSANMLAYTVLYKDKISLDISTRDFTDVPYNFQFPNLSNVETQSLKFNNIDAKYGIELSKLMYYWNESKTEDTWRFFLFDDMTFKSTISLTSIFLICIECICICAIIYVYYQVNNLRKSLILLTSLFQKGESLDFTLPPSSIPKLQITSQNADDDFWKTVLIFVILVLVVYCIVQLWVDKLSHQNNNSHVALKDLQSELFLCFFDNTNHLFVKICILPGSIETIKIVDVANLNKISFKLNWFSGMILINWSSVKITINDVPKLNLPTKIKVPFGKLNLTKQLAKECHTMKFVLVAGQRVKEITSISFRTTGSCAPPLPTFSKQMQPNSSAMIHLLPMQEDSGNNIQNGGGFSDQESGY